MQKEQLKHSAQLKENQINNKPVFNNNQYPSNMTFNSYNTMQDSKSSLTTSSSSLYSTSSSNSSLNKLPVTNGSTIKYTNSFDSLNQNDQLIYSLKKSLDELTEQKNQICNKLKELSSKEMELKSKLTSQDLDDILRQLKSSNTKKPGPIEIASKKPQGIAAKISCSIKCKVFGYKYSVCLIRYEFTKKAAN